jgi:hypothetical protein
MRGVRQSSSGGRTVIYRADVKGMGSLISFLINDCCNGRPGLCGLLEVDVGATHACAPPIVKKQPLRERLVEKRIR